MVAVAVSEEDVFWAEVVDTQAGIEQQVEMRDDK